MSVTIRIPRSGEHVRPTKPWFAGLEITPINAGFPEAARKGIRVRPASEREKLHLDAAITRRRARGSLTGIEYDEERVIDRAAPANYMKCRNAIRHSGTTFVPVLVDHHRQERARARHRAPLSAGRGVTSFPMPTLSARACRAPRGDRERRRHASRDPGGCRSVLTDFLPRDHRRVSGDWRNT